MKKLNEFWYKNFYIASFVLIIYGLLISPIRDTLFGLLNVIKSPSVLVSDYMEIGGLGASYVNAGLMLLFTIILAKKCDARLTGALIAAMFTVTGFSFFGKNIVNSVPLMLGVYLYVKLKKLKLANYMHIVCFVTGLSPIVSLFMFSLGFKLSTGIVLGIIVGILVGLIIIPLSSSMLKFHDGYSLYNVGFSLGIIAIVLVGILRMFDKEIPSVSLIYYGNDIYTIIFFLVLSLGLMIYGLIKNKGLNGYKQILESSGRLITDFTIFSNRYLVIFNIGLMGLICFGFVFLSGGKFNGPIVGGILTVMGFGAFGKHPKNVLPIMLGVYIASMVNKYEPSSTLAILTALFSTTIAPIAGEFGIIAGIFAGFIHKAVATNVTIIHGGINLYNNGIAGGMVSAVLVPLYKSFVERRNRD